MIVYAANNRFKLPLDQIDLDETLVDQDLSTTNEKGTVFQTGWTYRRLALAEIGRMINHLDPIIRIKEEANQQKRKLATDFIDNLKSAVNTLDGDITSGLIKEAERIYSSAQAKTASINDKLKEAPKSAQDFERMHSSSNDTVSGDTLERMLQTYHPYIQAMDAGNHALNQMLKQKIIALHKQYPGDTIASRMAKENLRNEINAAYGLNQTFKFDLSVDQNRGGEIKNSDPNASMLIEEYEKFTHGEKLTPDEKDYKQSIEEFISKTDNMYLKNAFYLRKAEEFANNDNNGNKLNDLVSALSKISRGDRPTISPKSEDLGDLRQNAEYHWGHFIERISSIANDGGIDALVLGLLHAAARGEQSRLSTHYSLLKTILTLRSQATLP